MEKTNTYEAERQYSKLVNGLPNLNEVMGIWQKTTLKPLNKIADLKALLLHPAKFTKAQAQAQIKLPPLQEFESFWLGSKLPQFANQIQRLVGRGARLTEYHTIKGNRVELLPDTLERIKERHTTRLTGQALIIGQEIKQAAEHINRAIQATGAKPCPDILRMILNYVGWDWDSEKAIPIIERLASLNS